MSVDVTSAIDIAVPREVVAAYAGDPSNAPEWYENIRSVAWHGEARLDEGAQVDFRARFLGRDLAYTYTLVEVEPGRRLVMRTAEGPFPMETTYEWSDTADGGTRMTLRNRGEPSGFAGLASGLMSRAMKRATDKDLRALKAILERRAG